MHFSITLTLGLHFLFCQGVSSSSRSFFKNQTLFLDKVDGVLRKFWIELDKDYLQKNKSRQVMIVGASNDQLRNVQPLIENNPYNICHLEDIRDYPNNFLLGSFMIIFLNSLRDKSLEDNYKVLTRCNGDCKLLFVLEGVESNNNDLSSFVNRLKDRGVGYSITAYVEETVIKLYLPTVSKDCVLAAELLLVWKPGTDLSKINFAGSDQMLDLMGCPIRIGAIRSLPQMMIKESSNGSKTIVGGREGRLVLLIAELLNFIPVVEYPTELPNRTQSRKEVMIDEVASGNIIFAIGRLRPANNHHKKIEYSYSYGVECVTWGVPRRINSAINLVWTEFPWGVWVSIAVVFAISCAINYAYRKMDPSKNGNRKLVKFSSAVLDMLAINLGNPVIYIPISTAGKFALILYLFYSVVITTGYKTSLASILATVPNRRIITDAEGIIKENLKVGGSLYNLNILIDQEPSETFTKLIERYEVIHDNGKLFNRLKTDHNFACLARRSAVIYEKRLTVGAQEMLTFDVFSNCFLTYPSVIVLKEGSLFTNSINKVLLTVLESGILKFWDRGADMDDKISEKKNADKVSGKFTKQKFGSLFIFYGGCLCVCLFVFFIELLTARLKLKKIRHVAPRRLYKI